MNTVQNGKGDRPRNNWGENWYSGYDAIDWRRDTEKPTGLSGQGDAHPGDVTPSTRQVSRATISSSSV